MSERFHQKTSQPESYLQSGTIIDQYMIERELAHGGFSSVYLARQTADQIQVAIKEYLPRKLAHRIENNAVVAKNEEVKSLFRQGRTLFFEEAKVLATLKHPNIVQVVSFFEANSTVYMVMNYDYGVVLEKTIRKNMLMMTEPVFLAIFDSLLRGIAHIHRHNFVHLDIKPGNILVRPGNDALLLDFGAIQKFPDSHLSKLSKVLTKGFSPIEQYNITAQLGPWTDIYAIGATMRFCLEGKIPLASPERIQNDTLVPAVKAFKRKLPGYLLEAIDWAMALQPKDRPQSITEFQQVLSTSEPKLKAQ